MKTSSTNSIRSALKLLICSLFLFIPLTLQGTEYFLLVTGCGRSGTLYITEVLRKYGLDIRHEKFGKDGVVSWYMGVDGENPPWGPSSVGHTFKHIFHQIRDPIKVINSFYHHISPVGKRSWNWTYIYQHIPEIQPTDHPLAQVAKYWYYWNLACEEKAEWTYRIEDIDSIIEEMGARLGRIFDRNLYKKVPKNSHKLAKVAQNKYFDWSDIEAVLSEDDYLNLRALAIRYGYD